MIRKFLSYMRKRRVSRLKIERAGMIAEHEEARVIMAGLTECSMHFIESIVQLRRRIGEIDEKLRLLD